MNAFEREIRRFATLTHGRMISRAPRLLSRRATLGLGLGTLGLGALGACGGTGLATGSGAGAGGSDDATGSGGGSGTGGTAGSVGSAGAAGSGETGSCILIPEETEGPYPLFADIATASKYIREDITEDKPGIVLSLGLSIVNVNDGCAPITDALVYVWHCDKDGVYSGYNQPGSDTTGETFCRGVQPTDASGNTTFDTIFPGWYQGRITHIHFRVYLSDQLAATSQLAFPEDITTAVYTDSLYSAHGQNTSVASVAADMVFADGAENQTATTTESAENGGYEARLRVGIAL